MGRRGPPPTPTVIKELQGNPGKRPLNQNEPKPKIGGVTCPPGLSPGAQAEWERIAGEMESLGLLTVLDRAALAAYCQHWDDFTTANENIQKYGDIIKSPNGCVMMSPYVAMKNRASEMMYRYAQQFGFTPSARESLGAPMTFDMVRELRKRLFGS